MKFRIWQCRRFWFEIPSGNCVNPFIKTRLTNQSNCITINWKCFLFGRLLINFKRRKRSLFAFRFLILRQFESSSHLIIDLLNVSVLVWTVTTLTLWLKCNQWHFRNHTVNLKLAPTNYWHAGRRNSFIMLKIGFNYSLTSSAIDIEFVVVR